jgi:hypothetical protein
MRHPRYQGYAEIVGRLDVVEKRWADALDSRNEDAAALWADAASILLSELGAYFQAGAQRPLPNQASSWTIVHPTGGELAVSR